MGVVQRKLGRCCVCLPLSHGVAALCILFFFLGLYDFLVLFLDDVRLQFNGAYFRTALYQKIEPFFATFYAPFGLLGFVGVMDEKASYVHGFWAFMTFHLGNDHGAMGPMDGAKKRVRRKAASIARRGGVLFVCG